MTFDPNADISGGKVRRREAKRRLDEDLLERLAEGDDSGSLVPPPSSALTDVAVPPQASLSRSSMPGFEGVAGGPNPQGAIDGIQ